MTKLDLKTTSTDMDCMWGLVHKAKSDTATIKISRKILCDLLLDHGKLLNHYEGKK